MPIYTYNCQDCNITDDYLVPTIGQKPEECRACKGHNLARIFDGQTFGCFKSSVRLDSSGGISKGQGDIGSSSMNESTLQPGTHITSGISRDGRETINVSRVTKNGTVDASVTGYKK